MAPSRRAAAAVFAVLSSVAAFASPRVAAFAAPRSIARTQRVRTAPLATPQSITTFEAALKDNANPVLVDFSATWCQPCKMLAPTIEAVAKEYDGKLGVYKIDIDSAQNTAAHFGISGVPTCIFFVGGREVERFTGNRDLRFVKELVDKVLATTAS